MKAVRIHEYGGPEQLRFEEDVPEPQVTADTVLIEAAAASVNPIDWKMRSGARQKDFPLTLPAILGKDVSGIVRTVGSNVHNFKVGDRVVAFSNATYAELVAVESSLVTHLPDGVDLKIDKQTHLVLSGYDKQMIGQVAANIRALRSPDPYKNKGVRYTGEALRKKAGKTGAGAKGK